MVKRVKAIDQCWDCGKDCGASPHVIPAAGYWVRICRGCNGKRTADNRPTYKRPAY